MCCPTLEGIEVFESYSNTDDNTNTEDYYYDYEHVYDCNAGVLPTTCPPGSSCVGRNKCGKAGTLLFKTNS